MREDARIKAGIKRAVTALLALMMVMMPGCFGMPWAETAFAAETADISGTVNTGTLTPGTDYRLTGNTTINVISDLEDVSFDMGTYDLTITGNGRYELGLRGITGAGGDLLMKSGLVTVDDRSLEEGTGEGAVRLNNGSFKMTGGTFEVATRGTGIFVNNGNIEVSGKSSILKIDSISGPAVRVWGGAINIASTMKILAPVTGRADNDDDSGRIVFGHDYTYDPTFLQIVGTDRYDLGVVLWDTVTGREIPLGCSAQVNGKAYNGGPLIFKAGDTVNLTAADDTGGTYSLIGWAEGTPSGEAAGSGPAISFAMPSESTVYYALFEPAGDMEVNCLTLCSSAVPSIGQTAVKPTVRAAEAGVVVDEAKWCDASGTEISESSNFRAGQTVDLVVSFSMADGFIPGADLEENMSVNGREPVSRELAGSTGTVTVEYTVPGEMSETVSDFIAIEYDDTRVFPSTRLTGREVTLLLDRYTEPDYYDDDGWYVHNAGDETPDPDLASWYTCLTVKEGTSYTRLNEWDEGLSKYGEYYLCFDVENDYPKLWDPDRLPYVTVNGLPADDVRWFNQSEDGDIFVYKRVYPDETSGTILSMSLSPEGACVQKGGSRSYDLDILAATDDSVTWDVMGAMSPDTYAADGVLYVGADESAFELTLTAISSVDSSVRASVTAIPIDQPVQIDSVELYADTLEQYKGYGVELNAEVRGTELHDVTWEVIGAESSETRLYNNEGMDNGLYIADDETAEEITVKVTSVYDPSKSAEVTIAVLDRPFIQYPLEITFDESAVVLSTQKTGEDITKVFRRSITTPFGIYYPDEPGWFVYGALEGDNYCTALVYWDGEDYVNLYDSKAKLTRDRDYYLWFNIEKSADYFWENEGDDDYLPTVTVNGFPADDVMWGGSLEVYYKIDFPDVYIPRTFDITYDASKAFPTARLTGSEVDLLLNENITSNPGHSEDGNGWYVELEEGRTCLVYWDGEDYVPVSGSDEKLSADGDYYFRFNIEDEGRKWRTSYLPRVTVNGEAADDIFWDVQAEDGGIFVYKKVEPDEINDTILSLAISPKTADVFKGGSISFEVSTVAATTDSVVWTVEGGTSQETAIDQNGVLTVGPDETGEELTVKAVSAADGSVFDTALIRPQERPLAIDRIAGANRYMTAFDAAGRLKKELGTDSFANVVIASGTDFPDALAGAYLAKVKDAPILLTNAGAAPIVAGYIKENMAADGTVYILGGSGAVPEIMETELGKLGITSISRLAGSNRYLTNIEILKEAGVSGEPILICSGNDYADSLSASAVGRPILLVGDTLLPAQIDYLESIKDEFGGSVYAIGGIGAVKDAIYERVGEYCHEGGELMRIAGANRYTTSVAIAEKFFPSKVGRIVLAYAQNYPDGLAGGPIAYALDSPLLLVTDSAYSWAGDYAKKVGAVSCTVMGGTAIISDATALAILEK